MCVTDDSQGTLFNRPRASRTRLDITTDASGAPELPDLNTKDRKHVTVIQKAIRDYCIAHIRECK
jgi:hypothetical protein